MNLFFILIYSLSILITLTCSLDPELKLIVNPSGLNFGPGPPVLIRRVDENLNLTCRLENNKQETLPNYNISWNWQYSMSSYANRVMVFSLSRNEANLVFVSLKETDSGEYTCKCQELNLTEHIRVKVTTFRKYRGKICGDKMFLCPMGHCIAKRFVCDGKEDCKDGADEGFKQCGTDPCEGKIPCENDRCIPLSSCCDKDRDPNCTVKIRPDCCPPFIKSYMNPDSSISDQHFSDMGFLQTTIYTVIGCAMAFMFIVTILVIAICRVHIKRTLVTRCPLNHQHPHARPSSPWRPSLPLYDIDVFLERHEQLPSSGLLVTYNINHGVQFVGRPIDPPPYCEIIESPPREGPPPPYVSRENLRDPPAPTEPTPSVIPEAEPASTPDIYTVTSNRDVVASDPNVSTISHARPPSGTRKCSTSLGDIRLPRNSDRESYSSNPSVSGVIPKVTQPNMKQKRSFYSDISDTESESSYMENDALLNLGLEPDRKVREESPVESATFIDSLAAVSKNLIDSFSKRESTGKRENRQLITQKSFDGCNRDITLANARNDSKNSSLTTHSLCDLSPLNSELSYSDFETREYLTMPLRESFIGICKDEV